MNENFIPININLNKISYLITLIFISTISITYTCYFLEGRYLGYLPSVSETAIGDSNTQLFSASMTLISFFLFISIFLILIWSEIWNIYPKWVNIFLQINSYLLPILLILISIFPIDFGLKYHLFAALPFFYLSIFFSLIISIYLFNKMNGFLLYFRIFLIFFIVITFLLMNFLPFFINLNQPMTYVAIFEVTFIILLCFIINSFSFEINSINAQFFIII